MVWCLLLCQPVLATAQALNNQDLERFNVMLVIDGSGSLVYGDNATDANGLRYDALDLFLALLTNSGNNVGAIVFDNDPQNYLLNTGLQSITGKSDKISLSDQIRQAGTRDDTDIGSALLTAVETLNAQSAQNGMESVIILFSDGRTDLGGDQEAYEASLENKETAITTAQTAGIPVYSICLNATSVADPAELQEISSRTSGSFVAVSSPEDLTGAFEAFYNLIFSTSSSERVTSSFPSSGKLTFNIDVPTYGAEEVNIILDTDGAGQAQLTAPSGPMSAADMEDSTMTGGDFNIIKLVDPEVGRWTLELSGVPQDNVTINVIYNIDTSAVLATADGGSDYGAGDTVTLQAALYQNGVPITDSTVTSEYTAELTFTNMADNSTQTVEMNAGPNGSFTYDFQENDFNSYSVQVVFRYSNMSIPSNTIPVNFGNTAPVVASDQQLVEESVIVTPVTGRERTFDLSNYFSDAQGDPITYSVASSQLVDGSVTLNGSNLTVNTAKSRSGDLVLRGTDPQGAYSEMTIRFQVTNLTPAIFSVIVAALVAVIVIVSIIVYKKTHIPFRGSITVTSATSMSGSGRSHANFKGKIKLLYFAIGSCGMDAKKCWFVAQPGNRLEFRSPVPVYWNGMPTKKVNLLNGSTEIYADENRTLGIRVTVKFDYNIRK
ncbi:VWA domain-containing protein [Pseudoflavonifractor phocaeensis]|uniref:VWA domain-containing protein n=1 Tax=Pseudoflavonifractor phocaeensis TaxID=1870988 RepID=UPI001959CC5C|nr:VWA domain-containing protein [Pseudoflavonifractor phocaeensis]MBM6939203.1 VWA domain-containing protein [Pseudoflavonifractor phocaeensis]